MINNCKLGFCGGDWRLVALLVFKTSVGPRRSWVGSIPIRLRHFLLLGGEQRGMLWRKGEQVRVWNV